jgi:hypothetical protein
MRWSIVLVLFLSSATQGCQGYPFSYQRERDRQGAHLRFEVTQPSLVDILFVVDNSVSMTEEQAAIRTSLDEMLGVLAPKDSHYRIGVTSTDAHGFNEDCCGAALPPSVSGDSRGNRGVCQRCGACESADPAARCGVALRRPHDGARGRLVAAYDPEVFDVNATDNDGAPLYDLASELRPLAQALFPTGVFSGGGSSLPGVPWVIDRQVIAAEACAACNCSPCVRSPPREVGCFERCVQPIATTLVAAYFNANVNGLGTSGWGWEEGLKAGLLAVGIDPEETSDEVALAPAGSLVRPGGANTLSVRGEDGETREEPWARDDAVLALVILTDEEDCSMPAYLMGLASAFEEGSGKPTGSICYQEEARRDLLRPERMRQLLLKKKETSSRVAVCMIGGLAQGAGGASATAGDCRNAEVEAAASPPTDCSCLTGAADPGWCDFTTDPSAAGPTCDALAARRYVDFAAGFDRRTFDSVCRSGRRAFGPALAQCARIATETCFELKELAPAEPSLLTVERTPGDEDVNGPASKLLPRVDDAQSLPPPGGGWYYDGARNAVCLTGLDRLVGDVYDIFVLHKNDG